MYKPKVRVTQKHLKNVINPNHLICCNLPTLLNHLNPDYYTCGVYGWNADIYVLDRLVIVTGYRPFGKRIDYKLARKYEEKAKQILNSRHLYTTAEQENIKNQLNELIAQFENEVLESVRK